MVKPQDIVRHELIGMDVTIADSTNKEIIGTSGKIVDETRNTLTIDTPTGTGTFGKAESVFIFNLPSGERVRVKGDLLLGRPEDRVKKVVRKW